MATARSVALTSAGKFQEAKDADTQITSGTIKNNSGSYTIDAAATSLILQVAGSTLATISPTSIEIGATILPDTDEAYSLGSAAKKMNEIYAFLMLCSWFDAGNALMQFGGNNATSDTSETFRFSSSHGDCVFISNQGLVGHKVGNDLASASTITPKCAIHYVTGTTTISTITKPDIFGSLGGQVTLIPQGIFSWNTAGNIAIAGTSVVNKAIIFTWEPNANKWYPSTVN